MIFSSENLARRRAKLMTRCAQQRADFEEGIAQLREGVPLLNLGLGLLSKLRERPWLYAGLAATVLLIRPRRLLALPGAARTLLNVLKLAGPVFKGVSAVFKR